MRITADKLDSKPEHGVSALELRSALRRLPAEWIEDLKVVRLSSSMKSWDVATFSTVTKRLVICSRGKKTEEVYRAMIRELYLHSSLTHPMPEWRLSPNKKEELDAKLSVYLRAVMEEEPNQPVQRNASTGSVSNLKSPARRG
jgi:hypothetical protein